ncbi:MAG TPA: glycogen debranching N-terminal domain-containing protein [Thermomicrobiaceae bacterium]|nr:glycogen debranching N-terminal domain-containing protein [Thermomicrobiaceae bacterium]
MAPRMAPRAELRARANHRFTYGGRSLLISDVFGVVRDDPEGFYFENTRLLCRDRLLADGQPLIPFVASPVDGSGFLAYAEVPESGSIPPRSILLTLRRFVEDGLRQELTIESFHRAGPLRFELALELAADFADLTEAESGTRQQTGPVETSWDAARRELCFRYQHPKLDRAVAVRVVAAPDGFTWDQARAAFVAALTLEPRQPLAITLSVEPIFDGRRHVPPPRRFGQAVSPLDHLRRELSRNIPRLIASNAGVVRTWETATRDLAASPLGVESGPAAAIAGLPMYQQLFGRDTLTIGWQAALALPLLLRGALRMNAAWQGTVIDDWRDEEPGKLLHQARNGPLSALGYNPFSAYYGDYATPPDFIAMLGQYLLWTNDLAEVRRLLPAARATLQWLDRYGDRDGDGLLEYVTRSSGGLTNQGWKDSWNAIVYPDGGIVSDPIATCEIQGYWYAGLQQLAFVFAAAGDEAYAVELWRQAARLKRRFNDAFWMEDEGFYAMALDPDKRQVRSIASNPSQLLVTGIVPPARGRRVVRRLMQPDLFSGWGIRTLSSEHPAYNPFSYHLGSVWPVDTGTAALGFARYGCFHELHRLAEGLFAAADLFNANQLPEVLGGVPRDAAHPHPGIYPESNQPQGWSGSSVVLTIQALLGLRPAAPLGLLLVDPALPAWLPELELRGIRVGNARLNLRAWRDGERTRYRVYRQAGRVRVLRQPPPNGPHGTLLGRARFALGSLGRT